MHESDDAKQSAVLASSSRHACVLLFACCARAHIRVTAATRASRFARGVISHVAANALYREHTPCRPTRRTSHAPADSAAL